MLWYVMGMEDDDNNVKLTIMVIWCGNSRKVAFLPQGEPFAWRSSEFGFSQSSASWQHSGGKGFIYFVGIFIKKLNF